MDQTVWSQDSVANLLKQAGHQAFCQCAPCRLIKIMLGQTRDRITECGFEDCITPALSGPDAGEAYCADHTCPRHSEYDWEDDERDPYRCAPPCIWNCGCHCRTCLDAKAERAAIGHQENCRCVDCGCNGDLHGDCGVKCAVV